MNRYEAVCELRFTIRGADVVDAHRAAEQWFRDHDVHPNLLPFWTVEFVEEEPAGAPLPVEQPPPVDGHEHEPKGEEDFECAHCGVLLCPDTWTPVGYNEKRGYWHLDGTACFLHQAVYAPEEAKR